MFVDVIFKGRATLAMIDTGATHNFVVEAEAKRLDLKLDKDETALKRSKARPIAGVAKDVELAIGPWRSTTNLIVGLVDNFGKILEMDFLASSNTAPMLHLWVLSFLD